MRFFGLSLNYWIRFGRGFSDGMRPIPSGSGCMRGIGGMRRGRPGAEKGAVSASVFIIYIIKNRINIGYDFISK